MQAFAQGALDYLVKPVDAQRLHDTVQRLQQRLQQPPPLQDLQRQLQQLAERLSLPAPTPLRWLHAQVGNVLRVIPCSAVDFLRADSKYTQVGWREDDGRPGEAVIALPLKDLVQQLDPDSFVQVHRSAVVNRHAVKLLVRGDNETAQLHLRGRDEVLPVSRRYLGAFRAM